MDHEISLLENSVLEKRLDVLDPREGLEFLFVCSISQLIRDCCDKHRIHCAGYMQVWQIDPSENERPKAVTAFLPEFTSPRGQLGLVKTYKENLHYIASHQEPWCA